MQEVFEFNLSATTGAPQQIHVPGPARAIGVAWDAQQFAPALKLFMLVTRGEKDQMIGRSFRVLTSGQPFDRGTLAYVGSAVDGVGQGHHVFEVLA